jgi:hypothetical protein
MSVSAPTTSKYLPIYLNDHLMGSTTGIELVRRIAHEHRGTDLGTFADGLAAEIEEDRDALLEIMERLRASRDQAKVALGWVSEKAARLKPNGELRGTSPLTPLVELESLSLGIEGKRSLWLALAEAGPVADLIGRDRLAQLEARAGDQRERVEVHRRAAVHRAFTAG